MKKIVLVLFLLLFAWIVQAQKFTISGHVFDEAGESLVGANVIVKELTLGTVTNPYGFYSITLPKGTYTLEISYMGYGQQNQVVDLSKDTKLVFNLKETSEMIESVTVTAERRDVNIRDVSMSSEKLDIKTIERIPTFMGEADVIKAIQLQPGVSVVGEGTSGFYVRGGAVDQNLILLDEAVVYNPSHFGGFFSVFNPDAIKSVELFKGGIPAKYGGRQSSVLDVQMRDGNAQRFAAKGGVGTLASRVTLEAPINEKSSFLVSGRRTYYDMFFPLFNEPVLQDTKVFFWDVNVKGNYHINENNRVFLSLYSGKDVVKLGSFFQMGYGNATGTLRWNHVFNSRLFSNFMFIGSRYNYSLGQPTGGFAFDWTSRIDDYSFKNDYTYYLNPNNSVCFGVQLMYHKLLPGKFEPLGESTFNEMEIPTEYSYESAVYVCNEQNISDRFSLQYGLRFSMFNNAGGVANRYNEEGEFLDSLVYEQGNIYNTYYGFEPRIGARYTLNEKNSVKASYNRMIQYLHLATNSQAPTPFDIWFTSNQNIQPQLTDQIAVGYFRNFNNNMFEASVEGYYKWLNNTIDFKDHSVIFGNEQLDGEVRQGVGYAYGAEFYVRKSQGKLTGWVSYTWSLTRRKIEDINHDNEYPTNYDRPNDIKIVLSYDATRRLNVSANWVYYTAMPFTVATSYSRYQNYYLPKFSDRNAYRFPGTDYHRLDLAATIDLNKVPNRKYQQSLTLSVYNAYNRHNLYSVLYVDDPESVSGIQMNKMYLFKVIPAITYNFTF
ncbi:MAG: TonB-dependent receptor [Bacteroidota bacterium]|nr:MAG: TonB-dependent receptor [Bacteroidota bacterium]